MNINCPLWNSLGGRVVKELLSGNEAIARGAWEAGVKFAAGYPGTPSTEILENLVKYYDVKCQWSPNEKTALETGIGASFAGVRSLVTMKHVGMNVAADPLFTVSYTGVKGGLVIVCADDPELHSSQNEQDNRNYGRAAKVPILEPADSEEARKMLIAAFDISEKFDTPVILRTTTRIAHTRTPVETADRIKPSLREGFDRNPQKYVMIPAFARKRHQFVEERLFRLAEFGSEIEFNFLYNCGSDKNVKTGIITSGVTYNYVREIINDIDILKLGMTYPLPEKLVKDFCAGKNKIYVIEELDGFIEEEILKLRMNVEVIGKSMFPKLGEFTPERIQKYFYGKELSAVSEKLSLPGRPPVLCAGCPHRAVFSVLRDKKLIVTGDIGCYTLGVLPPLKSMDTCVCMGAGIGTAIGMVKAIPDYSDKLVAVIGDSTFVHSGITGIIDALYNKAAITVLILDNSITAMTGHQNHPGTGLTLSGEETIALDYYNLARGIGYPEDSLDTVNPLNISKFTEILEKHLKLEKPSVIIAKSPCALLLKKAKPVYFKINEDKCVNCRKCLNTGCPAIQLKNDKPDIIANLCMACSVCKQYCEFDAIIPESRKK